MATCETMIAALLKGVDQVSAMLKSESVIAACIQAAETEHAARIGATATKYTGWLSFSAGLFALAAGALAYRATMIQSRQLADQRLAREQAFTAQVCAVTLRAREQLIEVCLGLKEWGQGAPIATYTLIDVSSISLLRDQLKPQQWETHFLLGPENLAQLTVTYEALEDFINNLAGVKGYSPGRTGAFAACNSGLIAKKQCEVLMQILRHKAPKVMQLQMNVVDLKSFPNS